MKRLRKLYCHIRGYHKARPPFLERLFDQHRDCYVLLRRNCSCGAVAEPKLVGEMNRPGAIIQYEREWASR